MRFHLNRIATVIATLSFAMTPTFTACSPDDSKADIEEPDTPDTPDTPDKPSTYYYSLVTESQASWDGDWIIAYVDGNDINAFHSMDSENGMGRASKIEGYTPADKIPAATGDSYKAVIKRNGSSYTINVTGVGYIGSSGSKKMVSSSEEPSDKSYLWAITFDNGYVVLKPEDQSSCLQYNVSASCFRFYGANSQKQLKIFKRDVSDGEIGGGDKPEPDPDPTPNPEPEPDPDKPEPAPGEASFSWFELPAVNDADENRIDDNDKTLYYAYHYCAGKEKGPGGKIARNFSVCYSSEHHCPVWVAAPRHQMYLGSTKRTNAYKVDPDIPAGIQNGKWSGYTRGHMLGSSDRTCSAATNQQVFYYSNIAPQVGETFNTGGGAWNNLEDHIDGLLCSDTLYTVVGCYFKDYTDNYGVTNSAKKISGDSSYPTMFYYVLLRTRKGNTGKAVTACSSSELECVAFVMRHSMEKGHKPQAKDMISVAELEKITGFKYFVNVPNAPKSTFNAADWL